MEPLPRFPLFPDPFRENVFCESDEVCGVCKRPRGFVYTPGHGGPATTDDLKVCPWCIANGDAGRLGMGFNDPTIYPYLDSTPQLSPRDAMLVRHRTPGFVTWQGNHWLMCCERACVYLGEATSEDFRGRWASAVPSMFEGENRKPDEIDRIVGMITRGGSPSAHVFQCQVCACLRAYYDCD